MNDPNVGPIAARYYQLVEGIEEPTPMNLAMALQEARRDFFGNEAYPGGIENYLPAKRITASAAGEIALSGATITRPFRAIGRIIRGIVKGV